jgi:DNA-binding transcriptional LysR family regulator
MDKLASIRAFTKIVEHGSFTKAARELKLSRSAVSKYVIELEEALGVQLLNRTTRSTSATENGLAYCRRCLAILTDLDEAELALARDHAAPCGLLRVNAPMSFGTLHLGPALAEFMGLYPNVRIELVLSDQLVDAIQEGFDVTLRIADLTSSSLIAKKIAPIPRIICAAPSYLERRGTPLHPSDLRAHDCLTYDLLATGNQWKLTGSDSTHWIAISGPLSTNNGEVLRDAAIAGRGIALLPTFIVGPDLRTGTLVPLLDDYEPPALSLYAIYPPTRHVSVTVRTFIDFLVARFGGR